MPTDDRQLMEDGAASEGSWFSKPDSYLLHLFAYPASTLLEITQDEFNEIKIARSLLVDALAFEQKYELLLANWFALESYATELALASQVESFVSHARSSEPFNGLNRHVMNLLSTARSYIDQVKKDFEAAPITPTFKEAASLGLKAAYDTAFEYRFMEALRNHVQHSSLPVHRVAPDPSAKVWAERLAFFALKSEIEDDGGFKSAMLAEMPALVDLRKSARAYVGALSAVHVHLRGIVAPSVAAARDTFDRMIERYRATGAPSIAGLRASAPLAVDEPPVPILVEWDDVRVTLGRKNAKPISLEGRRPELWPVQSRGPGTKETAAGG